MSNVLRWMQQQLRSQARGTPPTVCSARLAAKIAEQGYEIDGNEKLAEGKCGEVYQAMRAVRLPDGNVANEVCVAKVVPIRTQNGWTCYRNEYNQREIVGREVVKSL